MANCEKCGREFHENDLFEIDGEMICAECAEEAGYARCQDCGEWFERDDGYEYNGEPLCEGCYEYDYCTCEDCGEVILQDDAVNIYDHYRNCVSIVCDDCADNYPECIDCGRRFVEDEGYYDENGDFLDIRCYDYNGWATCEDCGCFTHEAEEGDDGNWYCPDCIGDHEDGDFTTHISDSGSWDDGSAIHSYGFKPRAVIRSRANDAEPEWTAGVELEVDGSDGSLYEKSIPTAFISSMKRCN